MSRRAERSSRPAACRSSPPTRLPRLPTAWSAPGGNPAPCTLEERTAMSVLVDQTTKVIVQGFTGNIGSFHAKEMLDSGTRIVGGFTPGQGGAMRSEESRVGKGGGRKCKTRGRG